MIRHTILSTLRNFRRYKSTFLINFIGLSTGLASALFIYLWIMDELHVDKFNEKDSQLFQVLKNAPSASGISTSEQTPGRLAETLAHEMPEIEYATAVIPQEWFSEKGLLTYDNSRIRAEARFISRDYFNVFSYDFIQGNKKMALSGKYNIILSEQTAMKVFHTTDNLIGRTVSWHHENLSGNFVVSGVFRELHPGSAMKTDVMFNYDLFLENNPKADDWRNNDPSTYLILKSGTDAAQFSQKISGYIKTKSPSSNVTLFVQRFSEKYLHNKYENGVPSGGRIAYLKLFSIVAIFILVNACINFMNLSTARALRRFKEVGIKKVVGATRKILVFQFLGESMMITLVSSVAAILLIILLLPSFNEITGKQLTLSFDANVTAGALGIALLTGIISGSYPSLYLSRCNPALVLKGKMHAHFGELWTRKGLVMFQSALSVILIVSTLVVYNQIGLVHTKNLGYDRDQIIYFEKGGNEDLKDAGAQETDLESFLQELKAIPGVFNATNFRHSITNRDGGTTDITWPGKDLENTVNFTDFAGGYDLIETLGIQMVEGRTFSRDHGPESSTVILNEKAIEAMGIADPVGKTVRIWGQDKEIIGVTKNFHFQSLYEEIKPLFFDFSLNKRVSRIMVKLKTGTEKETIDQIRKVYASRNPGLAMDYAFLDKDYQLLYESENKVAVLSKYFTGMAIVISCLGLFGLAAFAAERRLKEIGIRKVLGASELKIIGLLSADFTRIVTVAIAFALPVSYYITKSWLDSFSYRIDLTIWYFAGAALGSLFVAWFAVGFQTIKAAMTNPLNNLRIE